MNSMTGFGSAEYKEENFILKTEIKSVNNRYCDINIRLPKSLIALEDLIRKEIKKRIFRGKIDIFINVEYLKISDININADLELAREYYNVLSEIKSSLNLKNDITLNDIYKMDGVLNVTTRSKDLEIFENAIEKSLNLALDDFISMRKIEGESIRKTFELGLIKIKDLVDQINKLAPISIEEQTNKLKQTISTNLESEQIDLPRLTTELALMCDKLSIDEEITRIYIHLESFKSIMYEDGAIGRKLDFLVQELNREVNTVGSKSNNIEILGNVVELKSEIEKLREQIQNIE